MDNILLRNNVKVTGSGAKTLVFAHGFGCDQHVWRYFIDAFQEEFKIVVFDYVGAGQSDRTSYSSERYGSLNGYTSDLIEVLEALNLRNVIFVGHSVSSMIGLKASILKPEYFESLVLVAPSPCYINDGDYAGGMEKDDLDTLLGVMENNYLGWSSMVAPMVMGNLDQPELGEELTSNFCAVDPDIAKEFARVTFLSDCRGDLPKVTVKSLTLQCSEDMLAPLSVGRYIEQNTRNNSLVVMAATGHCPHLSAPEESINAVRRYIGAN